MVSGVGRGMGVLYGGGYSRREGAVLRVNLGRPIVTNGDFVDSISVRTIYRWNLCFICFLMM